MLKRASAFILAALSITGLSACSSNDEQASNDAEPIFSQQQESDAPTTVTKTVDNDESAGNEDGEESAPEAGNDAHSPAPEKGNHNINAGQIGGKCGYTNQGDSIHAGEHTSCEFTGAIFDEAITHTFTYTHRNKMVNGSYNTRISAVSPQTKQTYDLFCAIGSDVRTFHCQKDNDTSVYASFTSPNNERWTDRLTVEGQPY